ncbi:3-phosphoshikimate 1-carboxyvinyltransferase [Flavobacterium sp. KACC 22758]|jgi:3-phosphoshikimate 1-carboxyvinyltransferase|uniref:3-phosphoshikimate 1-carboxyvinyltransferase n=1 Tax=Flavobacterium sp. KACC 22758 TaxID=3025667 RepID=UPI002366310E|nr:3-phosphoshikimate 1-carboxyvinyltransferase [Flavobacterium sp. KACC 22758]WDF59286.1 3-phosphoshikimate 1-carboxyvinyltransferase [Flavobacterium sp. KACC 22758]
MNLKLTTNSPFTIDDSQLNITGSKSETNRLLLLKALFPNITLANTSNSDDSEVMQKALIGNDEIVDIHHAGTAMRFLTAYFAVNEGREVVMTGSSRMQERPIKILVDTLRQLGVEISYEKEEGYPPIRIKGKKVTASKVTLAANVSSQYISALLLVASKLENGLELTLEGEITSIPYIKMTLALLKDLDIKTSFEGNVIKVFPKESVESKEMVVESDWSSASYFFSLTALADAAKITLSSYKENSLQGDSELISLYEKMGVKTTFQGNKMTLEKVAGFNYQDVNFELNNTPDIAQTIVVTCLGLGIGCRLTGLHTLKIKETDRLEALKTELTKLGANISVTNDSLTLVKSDTINHDVKIGTYNDHRMAMAFAPLAIKVPIIIEDAGVVSKSYPDFWNDLKALNFQISEL